MSNQILTPSLIVLLLAVVCFIAAWILYAVNPRPGFVFRVAMVTLFTLGLGCFVISAVWQLRAVERAKIDDENFARFMLACEKVTNRPTCDKVWKETE